MAEKKKGPDLDETNYHEFAQNLVQQHSKDGQIIAALVWGRVIGHYERDRRRVEIAVRIYDLIIKETEILEFGNIGVALAYLMGAILKGGKVDIYGGERDPNMGALYRILVAGCPTGDAVWDFVTLRKDM